MSKDKEPNEVMKNPDMTGVEKKQPEQKKWKEWSLAEKVQGGLGVGVLILFIVGVIFALFSEDPVMALGNLTLICALLFGIIMIVGPKKM